MLFPDPNATKIYVKDLGTYKFDCKLGLVNHNRVLHHLLSIVNNSHQLKTYIFFPQMYKIQQNPRTVDKKYRYGTITEEDRQDFIDNIFFPAFRTNVHPSNALRFCKDDEQARRKGYVKHSSVDFMWQNDLKATIDSMKEIVDDPGNKHRFKKFREFYLISFAFGGKQGYYNFMSDGGFNVKPGDRIDVGFDYCVENVNDADEKNIMFFNKQSVYQQDLPYLLPITGREMKWHPRILSTFGGIECKNPTPPNSPKVILYSSFKHDFSMVKKFSRNNNLPVSRRPLLPPKLLCC